MSDLTQRVAEELGHVRRKRPALGIRGGVRFVTDTIAGVFGGVMVTTLLAIAGFLIGSTPLAGGIGAILGLLFSAKLLSRPNRDWRHQLVDMGYTVQRLQLEGPATRVDLPIDAPVRLAYLIEPGAASPESLLIDADLPDALQVDGWTWRFLVDAEDRPRLAACVTTEMREACSATGFRIRDGQARLTIQALHLRGLGTEFVWPVVTTIEALSTALATLATRLADPIPALHGVAQSPDRFDAVRATAVLIHERQAIGASAQTDWVVAMLSGRVTDALSAEIEHEAEAVRALFESGVPTDAWYAPLVYFARQLPADEAAALRAVALLAAVDSLAVLDRLEWLESHGTPAALIRLNSIRFSPKTQEAGDRTKAVLFGRFNVQGALAVHGGADGGLTIAETGQLSAPEE